MCRGQYPGEKEITFSPYTCLEADGDPRVEHTGEGEVVVFPLKVPPASLSTQNPMIKGSGVVLLYLHICRCHTHLGTHTLWVPLVTIIGC